MAKSRPTRPSIFSSTDTLQPNRPATSGQQPHTQAPTPATDRTTNFGRPRKHVEPLKKTTVVLRKQNLIYLDRLALDINERSEEQMDRSTIIRAIVEAIAESGIDFTSTASEEAIKAMIAARLQ